MKTILGIIFVAIAFIGAFYISIWWGIVQPIYSICNMVDAHTISAMNIAGEVVKFLVRDLIAVVWFVIFGAIGKVLIDD